MRERIRFVALSKVRRADGGYDKTNTTVADVWAAVKIGSRREDEQAGRIRGGTEYTFSCYQRSDLTTEMHVQWLTNSDVLLNIREVRLPPDRPLMMDVVAESGAVL